MNMLGTYAPGGGPTSELANAGGAWFAGSMHCPRCRGALVTAQIASVGGGEGAYRGSFVEVTRCPRCMLTLMNVQALPKRASGELEPLARSVITRNAKRLGEACGACMANLERLTLSWGETWAEVEECPRCGMISFDDGELDRVRALLGRAAELG